MERHPYVPVLAFAWLTPGYDRVCELLGFGGSLKRRIIGFIGPQPQERLLDVGTGTGTFLEELLQAHPQVAVTGIDPDPQVVAIAKRKLAARAHTGELLVGSADQLPFPDRTFEIVTSTLVFHHLPTSVKQRALTEIRRVLVETGRFYLTDFGQPQNWLQAGLLWLGSWFDGRENLRANLRGLLPVMLKEAGFVVEEVAPAYRGLRFLIATKSPRGSENHQTG